MFLSERQSLVSAWVGPSSAVGWSGAAVGRGLLAFAVGLSLFAALSQLRLVLPWTPVPVTGQTFAALLVALLWGSRLGTAVVAMAMLVVAPAFGLQGSLWALGATQGYLLGMLSATFLVGLLADRGWGRSWPQALLAVSLGTLVIYALGLMVLWLYVPRVELLSLGLWPFLPGDIVKAILAAGLSVKIHKKLSGQLC